MLKIKHTIVTLLLLTHLVLADSKDPFELVEKAPIDRTNDASSEDFLTDKLLKAFGEKRLDKGTSKRAVIRITILRGFHAPLLFKWYPSDESLKPILQIKRLAVKRSSNKTVHEKLDLDKRIELKASQEKLLKNIYTHSTIQDLPQNYWSPATLDGSTWIYEVAAEDSSILITRRNPIRPILEGTKITRKRLSRELNLTTFSLMLWTL